MALYYVGVMGEANDAVVDRLIATLKAATVPMGIDDALEIVRPAHVFRPPSDYSSVGVFFGGAGAVADEDHIRALMRGGTPFFPVVKDLNNFRAHIPACLHAINGHALSDADLDMERLAASVLGALGLLPKQRRIFLSYKRTETREAALQLFEVLSAKQFDVFLDTHGVPPGENFQDVLYHRMSDSDVLTMLDSPHYFESRWTNIEIGKALAKSLSVVRLGWPGVKPSPRLLACDSIQLDASDFNGLLLTPRAVEAASTAIERARSRCIAMRAAEMVGILDVAIRRVGGKFLGLGDKRTAVIELHDGHRVLIFPSTGVPTAEHLYQVATVNEQADSRAVIYDDCGVARAWQEHLDWLGTEIKSARWLTLGRARWQLSTWSEELAA